MILFLAGVGTRSGYGFATTFADGSPTDFNLVAGYCVVIPVGIIVGVKRREKSSQDTGGTRANSSVG